jgi:hypothetical protein
MTSPTEIAKPIIESFQGTIIAQTNQSLTFEVPYQQRRRGPGDRPPERCFCESVQQMLLAAGLHAEGNCSRFTIRFESETDG